MPVKEPPRKPRIDLGIIKKIDKTSYRNLPKPRFEELGRDERPELKRPLDLDLRDKEIRRLIKDPRFKLPKKPIRYWKEELKNRSPVIQESERRAIAQLEQLSGKNLTPAQIRDFLQKLAVRTELPVNRIIQLYAVVLLKR